MNIKIKRIGLLLAFTLCVALSTFAQPSGDYRRPGDKNAGQKIYREQSRDYRKAARPRRSFSFWSIILQLLIRDSSDFDRRRSNRIRNGRGRY